MPPQDPKLHHFLPRFYLKRFSLNDDGRLQQYDLGTNKVVNTSVNCAGAKNFLYTVETPEKKQDPRVEQMFADFDSYYAAAIQQCISNPAALSDEHKEWLLWFVTFQFIRVPKTINTGKELFKQKIYSDLRDLVNDEEKLKSLCEEHGKEGLSLEKIKETALKGPAAFDIDVQGKHVIGTLLQLYDPVFRIFFNMNWKILRSAGNNCFITSDNPVSSLMPGPSPKSKIIGSGGFGRPGVEVALPISNHWCLTGSDNNGPWFKYVPVGKKTVDRINFRTIVCAQKYLYAPQFSPAMDDQIKSIITRKQRQQERFLNVSPND